MLGDNIRAARKAKNLTLEELAAKIDSSSGTLSHIEKGTRNPSLAMINKIADALETTVLQLLNGDSNAENEYFKTLDNISFSGVHDNESNHLSKSINNNVKWGQAVIKEQSGWSDSTSLDSLDPVTVNFIKIPVLGKIPAGIPVEARENIIDYVNVPENEVSNDVYFYLQVQGDSMINSGIRDGYRVLVKRQPDVESGEIAVVRVNSHDATLKRVKKVDGQVILYPDNPNYDPIIIKEEGAEIIGKVVKVEFDPNKKY